MTAKTTPTPRVAVYLRQSMDRDGNELGIQRQEADVAAYLTARGWKAAATYTDNDVSALSRKPRPAFTEMLAAVDAGHFDVIAVRHTDRLCRRLAELEDVLQRLDAAGAYLISTAEGLDTSTDAGRLVARILGSVAQQEVERKGRRQASAARQAAELGLYRGGRRPFGWNKDGMTPHPTESRAVIEGYAAVLRGDSLASVAARWNDEFGGTPQGRQWAHGSVKDVLTNPRHAGLRRHRTQAERSTIRTDGTRGVVGKAAWEGIVSEETWRAVTVMLCDPARRKGGRPAQSGLLTGVAVCGACGETVHAGGSRAGDRRVRCRSGKHLNIAAEGPETYVGSYVSGALIDPEWLELTGETGPSSASLIAEQTRLTELLEGLAVDAVEGRITRDQLHAATKAARTRLDEIEAALAAARCLPLERLLRAKDPHAEWAGMTVGEKRQVIKAVCVPVIHPPGRGNRFGPEDVEFRWRGGNS